MENAVLDFIIYMKVGPFCGYSLEEIIAIKKEEESKIGCFYLGYSGSFCRPGKVLRFLQAARKENVLNPTLLFSTTPSNFSSKIEKSKLHSVDGVNWLPLSEEVLLVGSKYAFVARGLEECSIELDMSQYRSMLGKRIGKTLDKYVQYRVDKTCAIFSPDPNLESKIVNISYKCELVWPYCVLVK